MAVENNSLERTIDQRHMFLLIGCVKYPYSKIKALFGNNKVLNLEELSSLPIPDDEKVQAIERADFFSPPLARLLSLKFARSTYLELKDILNTKEKQLCEEALITCQAVLTGAAGWDEFYSVVDQITEHLKLVYYNLGRPEYRGDIFKRMAALEIMQCLSRTTAKDAMRGASSIQRDVFGEEKGTDQLQDMLIISRNHFLRETP